MALEPHVGDLIIWGSSGHAKVLAEIAQLAGARVIGLFDRDSGQQSALPGVPVHHGEDALHRFVESLPDRNVVAAITAIGGERGADRLHYLAMFRKLGLVTPSAIHPTAWVSPGARLGANCQVLAKAAIGVDVILGDACIVNTSASVDHECRLGDGVHIGPGAHLSGCVEVGANAFVGTGASVLPRIRIGDCAIIGAGAVVTQDVSDGTVVGGCPAKPLRQRQQDQERE